jgi:hypothetical protein
MGREIRTMVRERIAAEHLLRHLAGGSFFPDWLTGRVGAISPAHMQFRPY